MSTAAPAPQEHNEDTTKYLSKAKLYILAVASAVVTANAYYIHPIIARVAEDFSVSAAMIGAVPALNQIALALGILLLLPLGDRVSNRRLTSIFVAGQFCGILAMALVQDFQLFIAGSTILGFFTIAPYLLPAYVSKRINPSELGHATGILTAGIIGGILLARAGAGFLGENFGWRTVYFVAATLMLIVSIALPLIMEEREHQTSARQSYGKLIFSILPIIKTHPDIIRAGTIQALSFGIFLAVWLGLGLHLTSPEMGYGVDTVGYLAAISALNLLTTPRMGAWADKIGAYKARTILAAIQLLGVASLFIFGNNLWLLMIPLITMNLVGPVIDITGRMTFLNLDATVRTRLMTVYIFLMFLGGGMASWAGTVAYDWAGWTGNVTFAFIMSVLVLTLSAWSYRKTEGRIE
ncbi:MAG: MFS transporter [Parvibaculum sp.]|nr:MFS transporter [Parvibaculum sp.]|tara:strand:- start:6144 stop:7370 length:1227 start_codon:yes stop_codon:yes gene_type:complete